MKITSTRFGALDIADKDVIYFPIGVPGFPDVHRYILLDHGAGTPLKWLQAVEQEHLAFPLVPAADLLPDYHMTVTPEDLATLGSDEIADLVTFVILTIPAGAPERTTANLKAPILMNATTRLARQILIAEDYPIRHPLSEAQPAAVPCAG